MEYRIFELILVSSMHHLRTEVTLQKVILVSSMHHLRTEVTLPLADTNKFYRLEPVIIELERQRGPVIVISHQVILMLLKLRFFACQVVVRR